MFRRKDEQKKEDGSGKADARVQNPRKAMLKKEDEEQRGIAMKGRERRGEDDPCEEKQGKK